MIKRVARILAVCVVGWFTWRALDALTDRRAQIDTPTESITEHKKRQLAETQRGVSPRLLMPSGAAARSDAKLPTLPGLATLSGRVVDEATGNGVADVVVHGARRPGTGSGATNYIEARSDDTGAFRFASVSTGTWIFLPLHVEYHHPLAPGNVMDKQDTIWNKARRRGLIVEVAGEHAPQSLSIALQRGVPLRGKVLGPKDEPVADAPVRVHEEAYREWNQIPGIGSALRRRTLVRTDDAGRFSFTCFPEGAQAVRLGVSHRHFVGQWSLPIPVPYGDELLLRLWKPARVHGTVRWSSGAPTANAHVRLLFESWWLLAQEGEELHHIDVRSDREGNFRIDRTPPDSKLIA